MRNTSKMRSNRCLQQRRLWLRITRRIYQMLRPRSGMAVKNDYGTTKEEVSCTHRGKSPKSSKITSRKSSYIPTNTTPKQSMLFASSPNPDIYFSPPRPTPKSHFQIPVSTGSCCERIVDTANLSVILTFHLMELVSCLQATIERFCFGTPKRARQCKTSATARSRT